MAARIFLTSAGVRSIPFGWLQGFAMTFNCLLHVLGEVIIDEMRPSGFAFAGWDLGKYWRRSLKAVAFSTTKMFRLTVGDPNGESLAFSVSSESETCRSQLSLPVDHQRQAAAIDGYFRGAWIERGSTVA